MLLMHTTLHKSVITECYIYMLKLKQKFQKNYKYLSAFFTNNLTKIT